MNIKAEITHFISEDRIKFFGLTVKKGLPTYGVKVHVPLLNITVYRLFHSIEQRTTFLAELGALYL